MITENTLRVKIETTGDGQLKASLDGTTQSVVALDAAQQAQAETAAKSTAVAAAAAETADQQTARIRAMVAASLEQQAANAAVAESERSLAERAGLRVEMSAAERSAILADAEATRAKVAADIESIAAQEGAATATAADTAAVALNTKAKEENAVSSRTASELGVLLSEGASGNFSRMKRSVAALGNTTGLLAKAFTPIGGIVLGAVAAVALFTDAAIKGAHESEVLRAAVIATGGAAGVSAGAFNADAVAVGEATGKYGDARKAIEQLAASGKVAGAGIGELARQAVDMSTVTGESIDKSVAKILELSQRPAEAIAKLNEQYHFLTSAEYAQIAALEAEGKTREAGRLANQLDATAMAARAHDVEDNAGLMERAAHGVAAAWGAAWDSLKGIGRTAGLGDQVQAVLDQIDALQGSHFDQGGNMVSNGDPAKLAALQRQLHDLRGQQAAAGFAAQATALDAGANTDAIAAQQRLARAAPPSVVHDDAIKKINADHLAALYGVVDPAQKALIEQEYKTQLKEADNAYAAATKKLAGPQKHNPEPNAYNTFSSQVNALDVKTITADDAALAQYEQGVARLADQMAVYMSKGGDATKAAELFNRGQQDLQKTLDANHARETTAEQQYAEALDKKNAALQQSVDDQVASVGEGTKEYQRHQQITQQLKAEADALAELAIKRQMGVHGQSGGITQGQYEIDVAKVKSSTEEAVQILTSGYRRVDAAQANWLFGAEHAMKDYVDQAKNVSAQVGEAFTTLSSDMENSLADWATSGKLSFSSFEKDFENMLAHMVAKALIAQAETALIGLIAGAAGGGGTYDASAFGSSLSSDMASVGGGSYGTLGSGHAEGGRIVGPGTGTSDSIIARLSNGENVITADATQHYGQKFMDDVNNKRLPRFAQGGPVGGGGGASGNGTGAPPVTVNLYGAPEGTHVQQSSGTDGRQLIDVFIAAASQDVARGGKLGQAMQSAYGVRRQARSYATAGG